MKNKLLLASLALSAGLYTQTVSAQIFRIEATDYGAGDGVAAFESFVDAELLKVQNEINKDLPSAQPKRLMEGMANSSVMAGKGIGSDYASNMSVFLIGAGVGVGADLEKDEDSDSDLSGVGVAPGVIIGTNLSFLDAQTIAGMDTNRLNVYFNYMGYHTNRQVSDEAGKESYADLALQTMGFHVRYHWIEGSGSKFLGWGGVKFHFGYEYNKTKIKFNAKISEAIDETSSNGERINGTITGNPEAEILVNTHSIPIELSTDIQLFYLLSLYTGLGMDYNMGQAKGGGSLNAPATPVNCSGGVCGGSTSVTVQPTANIDATGKVNPLLFRGFAGVQINLPYIRIFGQVDKAFGNELIGATAGLRFAF